MEMNRPERISIFCFVTALLTSQLVAAQPWRQDREPSTNPLRPDFSQFLLALLLIPCVSLSAAKRPNIVVLLADDREPVNFIRNGTPVGKTDSYACQVVVDEAVSWLGETRDRDKPSFLNVWFHEASLTLQLQEINDSVMADSPNWGVTNRE